MLSDPVTLSVMAIVIFLAVGIHEYAHCKFADMAGDPTPGIHGRVTLNLFKHFDPLGTFMMFVTMISGYGIGWGKPAPMDPKRMRDPRWDFFIAVAAGPLSNLVQALIYGMLGRFLLMGGLNPLLIGPGVGYAQDPLGMLVYFGVLSNLSMAFFNLIPLGPLDGHWLIGLLMPERMRLRWFLFNRQYGGYILLAIVIGGQLGRMSIVGMIIGPVVNPLYRLIIGI